jgi:VIT1/CCC1 family predicted Fe2+/Mn2+ transporter
MTLSVPSQEEGQKAKASGSSENKTMKLSEYIGKYWAGAEVIYSVIIAMTFTSTLRGLTLEIPYYTVVYSALFCCIAWGIADGYFYAWERTYITRTENKIIEYSKSVENNEAAISLIKEELDDTILKNVNKTNREELYQRLVKLLAEVEIKRKLSTWDNLNIILATFLASTIAGIIVVFPFFFVDNLSKALNISNILGILLLFSVGYYRAYERKLSAKLTMGLITAILGIIIAVITTLLGG